MLGGRIGTWLIALAALFAAVVALNAGLRPAADTPVGLSSLAYGLATAAQLKQASGGLAYGENVSCRDYGPPEPQPGGGERVGYACTVTSIVPHLKKPPPYWIEVVTCFVPGPRGSQRCFSSGGDALQ